jgi:hypothetical protein
VRRALCALCAVLALVACGSSSGSPAAKALRDTAKRLDDVRSATMDLKMTASSPSAKDGVGFSLSGPFALPDKQGLPVADMKVTELRGSATSTVSFVSTGQAAYVVRGSRVTALPATSVGVGGKGGGLGTLRIDSWLRSPSLAAGETVDGVETDHISAGLDVATAFDDLGRLGEKLGVATLAGLRPLDAEAKARLAKSAASSHIEVWSGRKDHLLRKLVLTVTLTADVPPSLRSLVPVTLALSMSLADVNQPVHVSPPQT